MTTSSEIQLTVRLPPDLRQKLASEAERYGSSLNSEIVRAVRERMERLETTRVFERSGA